MTRRCMPLIAVLLVAVPLVAVCGPHAGANHQFPVRPVRILVPYAPGGATDIVAHLVADQMRELLGQPFIVESKPGDFGIPAIEQMARAKPDGYTLVVGNVSTNVITPII